MRGRWTALFLIWLFITATCVTDPVFLIAAREERLRGADESLALALKAVLEAEQKRADVSSMLVELNEAASALSRADALYREGRAADAAVLADQAASTALKVAGEAGSLGLLAAERETEMMGLAVVEWAVVVSATVVLGYLLWGWFSRWYNVRLLGMVVVEAGRDDL